MAVLGFFAKMADKIMTRNPFQLICLFESLRYLFRPLRRIFGSLRRIFGSLRCIFGSLRWPFGPLRRLFQATVILLQASEMPLQASEMPLQQVSEMPFQAYFWLSFGCFFVIFRVYLSVLNSAFSQMILRSIDTICPGAIQKCLFNFENS